MLASQWLTRVLHHHHKRSAYSSTDQHLSKPVHSHHVGRTKEKHSQGVDSIFLRRWGKWTVRSCGGVQLCTEENKPPWLLIDKAEKRKGKYEAVLQPRQAGTILKASAHMFVIYWPRFVMYLFMTFDIILYNNFYWTFWNRPKGTRKIRSSGPGPLERNSNPNHSYFLNFFGMEQLRCFILLIFCSFLI